MGTLGRSLGWSALSLTPFLLAGCPQVLGDDFKVVAGGTGGTAGTITDSGTTSGGAAPASGGSPSTGGSTTSGGGSGAAAEAGTHLDSGGTGAVGSDAGPCTSARCGPGWTAMSVPPTGFAAREKAASVMTASTVFIWGGASSGGSDLSDGALYDPRTDDWTTLPSTGGPPQARVLATAVWTGSIVVVWGGGDNAGTSDYATGGRFDPSTSTWQTMTTQGAPPAARAPFGVWTGSRVLFYGGTTAAGQSVLSVALYDPVNDAWSLGDTASHTAPSTLLYPTVAWTGASLLVVNGQSRNAKGTSALYSYDPIANTWTSGPNGPSARYAAFGAWIGTGLLDWAGNSSSPTNDGELYDPLPNKWTSLQSSNAPASRWAPVPETGWTTQTSKGVALVLGGLGFTSGSFYTDGAVYDSVSDTWTEVPSSPSGEAHLWGAGVWTGSDFMIWGGEAAPSTAPTTTGERYRPR